MPNSGTSMAMVTLCLLAIQLGENCTDYHSYFIALSRSAGIPARFAIGAAVPSGRDEGGISGYHCWAEFFRRRKMVAY